MVQYSSSMTISISNRTIAKNCVYYVSKKESFFEYYMYDSGA